MSSKQEITILDKTLKQSVFLRKNWSIFSLMKFCTKSQGGGWDREGICPLLFGRSIKTYFLWVLIDGQSSIFSVLPLPRSQLLVWCIVVPAGKRKDNDQVSLTCNRIMLCEVVLQPRNMFALPNSTVRKRFWEKKEKSLRGLSIECKGFFPISVTANPPGYLDEQFKLQTPVVLSSHEVP